jgi:tetratricopeptide (TPR) repeat protein
VAARVDAQARRLAALLRDGDRVRLFAVDTYVQQVWPLQPASAVPRAESLSFDGHASLFDALAAALLLPVEPARRHVIVASTRGLDAGSSLTAAQVRVIAESSDAQLHLVMLEVEADAEASVRPMQCAGMSLCRPTTRFQPPPRRRLFNAIPIRPAAAGTVPNMPARILQPDGLALEAAARATGGGLYLAELFHEPTLHGTFARAMERFRQGYTLRYTPRGVERPGWHRIEVRVPGQRSVTIQARPGYWVDAPVAPVLEPTPVSADSTLRSLAEYLSAYERGGYDAVVLNLRRSVNLPQLLTEFDRGRNPWPSAPRREAVFALELVEAGIYGATPAVREQATHVLDRFSSLVRRPLEPDAFERQWLIAAVAMLQGAIRPSVALPVIDRALARFPDAPRLHLARAITLDQRWPRSREVSSPGPAHVDEVLAAFDAAAAFPDVRAEALVRSGGLLHRTGRSADAVARLTMAAGVETTDRTVHYLRDLLLGQALMRLDRHDEALAAFRRAAALAPGAQSAQVGAMNALLLRGDRVEAVAIAAGLQREPGTGIDPWWMYWQGDYRRYPTALRQLREMGR